MRPLRLRENFTGFLLDVQEPEQSTHPQRGDLIDLTALGLAPGQSFLVDDLLNNAQYTWHARRNYVALRPGTQPAHIFRIVPLP